MAPAARKRSACAATGACCAVALRTAPSPLRPLALPPRSFRGLRKLPLGVLFHRGEKKSSAPKCLYEILTSIGGETMGKSTAGLGRELGLNSQETNILLRDEGYLEGEPGDWRLTDKGREHAE